MTSPLSSNEGQTTSRLNLRVPVSKSPMRCAKPPFPQVPLGRTLPSKYSRSTKASKESHKGNSGRDSSFEVFPLKETSQVALNSEILSSSALTNKKRKLDLSIPRKDHAIFTQKGKFGGIPKSGGKAAKTGRERKLVTGRLMELIERCEKEGTGNFSILSSVKQRIHESRIRK